LKVLRLLYAFHESNNFAMIRTCTYLSNCTHLQSLFK